MKLTIKSNGVIPNTDVVVMLDDKPITHACRSLSIGMGVGNLTVCSIDLVLDEVEVDAETIMDVNTLKNLAEQHKLVLITKEAYEDAFTES